jgi:hypothetical protein
MLREEMLNRLGALTADERKALQDRWHLAIVCFTPDQLRAIAGAAP